MGGVGCGAYESGGVGCGAYVSAGETGIQAISTSIDLNWIELSLVEVELANNSKATKSQNLSHFWQF